MSEAKLRCRSWSVWTILMMAMISYPLSIGPVVWLIDHGLIGRSTIERIEVFYFPLTYLCETVPGLEDLATGYVEMWEV